MSDLEDTLAAQLTILCVPFEREVRLIPGRKWAWDFVVKGYAIEVQGGIWQARSGHNTGRGLIRDYEKHNALMTQTPYRCLYFTAEDVTGGEAAQRIERLGRG